MALFAELFIDQLRESVKASQTRQLDDNKWPGGPTPYGLTTDDSHRLVVVEDQKRTLVRAANLIIKHRGDTGAVSRQLDKAGHKRRNG